jgi:hypothetical protein
MPRCIASSGTVILPEMGQLEAGQSPCLQCSWVAAQRILCYDGVCYMKFTSYFRFVGHAQVHCWFCYCDSSRNGAIGSLTISLPGVFLSSSTADSLLIGVCYMKLTSYFRFVGHAQVHCWFRYCDSSSNGKKCSRTLFLPAVFMSSSTADSLVR